MRIHLQPAAMAACLTAAVVASALAEEPPARFTFEEQSDALVIKLDDETLATYLFGHEKLTRPAFVNVRTPGGTQVTRNFPPVLPDDRDHPVMHPGIWIGFGHLHGQDYWRLKARVEHDGFVEPPQASGSTASFTVRNRYLTEDGQGEVCQDTTRYELQVKPYGLLMLVEAVFQSEQDFYFGDQEESGLAVRIASPLRVQGGNGTILNDRGERNGAEIWGKEARWVDYFGTMDGNEVGVMIMPSAANPRRCWIHARDYGVVVSNPFPRQPQERREPYVKTWVKQRTPFRLAYAVAIHETPPEAFDRDEVYAACSALLSSQEHGRRLQPRQQATGDR